MGAAQRFIDAHMLPQYHLSQIAEYIQQRVGQQGPTLGDTGGGAGSRNTSVATTGVPMASYQYIPAKIYKIFELPEKNASTTLSKMKKKLEEFAKLEDEQMAHIGSIMNKLEARSHYHSTKMEDAEMNVLAKMFDVFPS